MHAIITAGINSQNSKAMTKINIKTQIYVFLEQAGAGKSFYTKLLILRCRLLGIEQYIIDPEREYNNLCKNLNGLLLKLGHSSDSYINIFDIREESLEEGEQGYLANKISKLIGFFNLIFGNINEEEKALLEEKLIEVYKIKGITFDDSTLYKNNKDEFTKYTKVIYYEARLIEGLPIDNPTELSNLMCDIMANK